MGSGNQDETDTEHLQLCPEYKRKNPGDGPKTRPHHPVRGMVRVRMVRLEKKKKGKKMAAGTRLSRREGQAKDPWTLEPRNFELRTLFGFVLLMTRGFVLRWAIGRLGGHSRDEQEETRHLGR